MSQKVPRTPRAPGDGLDLAKVLPLVSGALGVVAFIAGFLPAFSVGGGPLPISITVFGGGPSYLPILLLIVGLLAIAPHLPGGKKFTLVTVLLSVAGFLGAVGSLVTDNRADAVGAASSTGSGVILLLIVAILLVASTGWGWLVESAILESAAPSAAGPGVRPSSDVQSPFVGSAPFSPPTQSSPFASPPAQPAPTGPGGAGGYPPGGYQPPTNGYRPYGRDDGPAADVTQQVRF